MADGSFLAIAGSTGSGKSTLAQHINGILRPQRGDVTVNGLALASKRTKLHQVVRQVGMSFQYPEHQLFAATVWEEVLAGPGYLGYDKARATGLAEFYLEHLGLSRFRETSPFALSGGEQRRLALASVLAMDTPILVLDEPTAGIDPLGRAAIGELFKGLWREKGKTVIWIGHDLEEIAGLAQRLVVMDRGRIVLDGDVGEVFLRGEELQTYGLSLPPLAAVGAALRRRGKPVSVPFLTEADALSAVLSWLEGKA